MGETDILDVVRLKRIEKELTSFSNFLNQNGNEVNEIKEQINYILRK